MIPLIKWFCSISAHPGWKNQYHYPCQILSSGNQKTHQWFLFQLLQECEDPLQIHGAATRMQPHQHTMVWGFCWSHWRTLQLWILCIYMHWHHNQSSQTHLNWQQIKWCHCQENKYIVILMQSPACVAHDNSGKFTGYTFACLLHILSFKDILTTNKNPQSNTYANPCIKQWWLC